MDHQTERTNIRQREGIESVTHAGSFFEQQGQTVNGNQTNVNLTLAHPQEWQAFIRPLRDETVGQERFAQLRTEFYDGCYTRFEHVLTDLDFRRETKLYEVSEAFERRNIVIIHASSGQGKTTLAYRYLRDHYPEDRRYSLARIQDGYSAQHIAMELEQLGKGNSTPIAIYIDIYPKDVDWVEVVRQLAGQPNLHLLVTIREEDFRRANIAGEGFTAELIDLAFNKEEAQLVYERTPASLSQVRFLNFDEAWEAFGGEGPLMEFVYLLTHTSSLRQRLDGQVFELRQQALQTKNKDTLRLLSLVAVASAYEARLQTRKLIGTLDLIDPEHTLHFLEQEYLIRRNQEEQTTGGLHSVRSQLLVELLTSPDINPWLDLFDQVLPLLQEKDMESFLLHAFVEHSADFNRLLQSVTAFQPRTWRGSAGLLRCLLWAGVRAYLDKNQRVITEAQALMGRAWYVVVHLNFADDKAQVSDAMWKNLEPIFDEKVLAQAIKINALQTPIAEAFAYAAQWLTTFNRVVQNPASNTDWTSVAEVLYWAGRLGRTEILNWLEESVLVNIVDDLSLPICGELSLAILTIDSAFHAQWLTEVRPTLERRLAQEEGVLWLEKSRDLLKIHFITGYGKEDELNRQNSPLSKDPLHAMTMRRIQLVHDLFPMHERYGAQGYGHKLQVLSLPFDSTDKSGVPHTYFLPKWSVQLGAIAGGLVRNQLRVATWHAYIMECIDTRQTFITCLKDLRRGLEHYLESNRAVDIHGNYIDKAQWRHCFTQSNQPPELPRVAVDTWGFSNEGGAINKAIEDNLHSNFFSRRSIALIRYQPFLDAQKEYLFAVQAFIMQSIHVMFVNGATKKQITQQKLEHIAAALKHFDIRSDWNHLTVHNLWQAKCNLGLFQRRFRELFAHVVEQDMLRRLEEDESRLLSHVWQLWYYYAYEPENVIPKPLRNVPQMVSMAKMALDQRIQQALHRATNDQIIASRIEGDLQWANTSTLWIKLDVNNPTELYIAYSRLVVELQANLNTLKPQDLEYYLLWENYESTVIVPLVRGRLISEHAFPLYTLSTLVSTKSIEENLASFAIKVLSRSYVEELGLAQWQSQEIIAANELTVSVSALMLVVGQIAEFRQLPDTLSQAEEVLQEYLNQQAKIVSTYAQNYIDTVTKLFTKFQALSDNERKQREYLRLAASKAIEIYPIIWPTEDGESISFTLESTIDYAQKLVGVIQEVELIRLLWIADALEHIWLSNVTDAEKLTGELHVARAK